MLEKPQLTKEQEEERRQILLASDFHYYKDLGLWIKGFPRENPDISEGHISFGSDNMGNHAGDLTYCEIYVNINDDSHCNCFKGFVESLEAAQQIANWMGYAGPNLFVKV